MMKKLKPVFLSGLIGVLMFSGCTGQDPKTKSVSQNAQPPKQKTEAAAPVTEPVIEEKTEVPVEEKREPADTALAGYTQTVYPVTRSIQEKSWYCGPAVMQMLLSHYGLNASQNELAVQMNTSSVTGTEYTDMANTASQYVFGSVPSSAAEPGFRSYTVSQNNFSTEDQALFLQRLKTDMESEDVLSAAIDTYALYPDLGIRATHVVLINGIETDEAGNIIRIRIEDPWYEIEYASEEEHWIDTNLFLNAMNQSPEPGYIW